MSDLLVSELSEKHLTKAAEHAPKMMKELISRPFLEGIIKGQERSGWIGIIHLGLWPTQKGFEKKYIIHTSLEGKTRTRRNVEADKIQGFFMAKYIMRILLDTSRTVYTPAIKGHKIVYHDKEKGILNREIYVNYEPRHLAFKTEGATPKEYAYLLGRDIASFMFVGMTNAPRHIRPNFSRNSIRKTCMIDIDQFDPRTFHWNPVDLYPRDNLNYNILLGHETLFFHNVSLYFLDNLLPKELDNHDKIANQLKSDYLEGAVEKIRRLKGNKAGSNVACRFRD